MYHKVKLSTQERIKAWLNLCDLTFKLLKDNLGEKELRSRLKRMREEQIQANYLMLKGLNRIK